MEQVVSLKTCLSGKGERQKTHFITSSYLNSLEFIQLTQLFYIIQDLTYHFKAHAVHHRTMELRLLVALETLRITFKVYLK